MIVVCTATGIGQRRKGTFTNALLDLHHQLRKLPHVEALHHKWTDNAEQVAARIAHELEATKVFLTGHSRGGEWCCDVCRYLESFGVEVDGLVLADAWSFSGTVYVPANVKGLWTYRQSNGRPRGSSIVVADPTLTRWTVDEDNLPVRHSAVDELACERGVLLKLVTEAIA